MSVDHSTEAETRPEKIEEVEEEVSTNLVKSVQ
jgi:hypothetical protein